eukprot:scaffold206_cov400-Prasinococcus_capsulatus_cf.AAC.3
MCWSQSVAKCPASLSSHHWCVQACAERVEKDTTGEAHCTGQYFDYLACLDKCVSSIQTDGARASVCLQHP